MRPAWRIVVDDQDVAWDLLELVMEDEPAVRADSCQLRIAAHTPLPALPAPGDRIDVQLGFDGRLPPPRRYAVDALGWETPPDAWTLSCLGALSSGLTAPRTAGWIDRSVGEIVGAIAERHGLESEVEDSLAGIRLSARWQVAQSDIDFLTELGLEMADAAVQVSDGRLIFGPRQHSPAARIARIEPVVLHPSDARIARFARPSRPRYGAAVAHWWDVAAAVARPVRVGQGSPVYVVPGMHREEAAARNAAETQRHGMQRATAQAALDLSIGRPDVTADVPVQLSDGWSHGAGVWTPRRVIHRLTQQDGYTTRVELERDAPAWTRAEAAPQPVVVPGQGRRPSGAGHGPPVPGVLPVPHRLEVVQEVARRLNYPPGDVERLTAQVAALLAAEDPRWGRRRNVTGPISSDVLAYRDADGRPISVDIVVGSKGATPRVHWHVYGVYPGSEWVPVPPIADPAPASADTQTDFDPLE